jgi:aspartyl-tRNA(Asn)/glutamyl-tRNA(Gln) amidotransferase subunit A
MYRTISEASKAIQSGAITPVELLQQCLARIDELEDQVHAWVMVAREEALEQARRLGDELTDGRYRGPLHGIPIGVKDIFDVFDWPTGCGSKLWANSYARQDCPVVDSLRKAGAVLMGKTVTTAYASFDPPPTRNPWDRNRTPGGSSSGSAAAIAAEMCLGALASQTGGSITRPASYCGVCGLKPSYGSVNADGVMPLAPSMDHVGVMGNCVRDLAVQFEAIAYVGVDATGSVDQRLADDRPPRLRFLTGMFESMADPLIRESMAAAAKKWAGDGAEIETVAPPAVFAEILHHHRVIMATEAATFHGSRMRRHPEDYPPKIRSLIEEGMRYTAPEYNVAWRQRDVARQAIERAFDFEIAVLVAPATTCLPPDASTTGDPAFNSPWSFTGLPVVSIPIAWTPKGLPIAVQFIGRHFTDSALLSYAAWCERSLALTPRRVTV